MEPTSSTTRIDRARLRADLEAVVRVVLELLPPALRGIENLPPQMTRQVERLLALAGIPRETLDLPALTSALCSRIADEAEAADLALVLELVHWETAAILDVDPAYRRPWPLDAPAWERIARLLNLLAKPL